MNDEMPGGVWALAVAIYAVVLVATVVAIGWVNMLLLGAMGLSVSFAQATAGTALAMVALIVIRGGLKR